MEKHGYLAIALLQEEATGENGLKAVAKFNFLLGLVAHLSEPLAWSLEFLSLSCLLTHHLPSSCDSPTFPLTLLSLSPLLFGSLLFQPGPTCSVSLLSPSPPHILFCLASFHSFAFLSCTLMYHSLKIKPTYILAVFLVFCVFCSECKAEEWRVYISYCRSYKENYNPNNNSLQLSGLLCGIPEGAFWRG